MREKLVAKLLKAHHESEMVLVERSPRHAFRLDGFVVGIGRKWAVLANTMEGGYFEGYVAFRLADVVKVTRNRTVASKFSRLQPEWPAVLEARFDLDTTRAVLQSFSCRAPLIGLEKERERRGLWIGEIQDIQPKWVWMNEVRPDATWRKRPLGYKLGAITALSIETHYLKALASIAGRAPSIDTSADMLDS